MADFRCPVVQITEIKKHPNADKLMICSVLGYQCITSNLEDGSPRYKVGDYVVYIPEASIVPDWMLKKMGFWDETNNCGTLSGGSRNRVKTIRLRKIFSQGIMYPVVRSNYFDKPLMVFVEENYEPPKEGYEDYVCNSIPIGTIVTEGQDVAELLGIKKYEPAIPQQMRGVVGNLYGYTKSFDVDNLESYKDVFQEGEMVVVTEKLHGTQASYGFLNNIPEDKQADLFEVNGKKCAYASSKGLSKQGLIQKNSETNQENIYVKMYKKTFDETKAANKIVKDYFECLGGDLSDTYTKVIVYGEIFGPGVQSGFTYGLKSPELRLFDVYIEWYDAYGPESKKQGYLPNDILDKFIETYGLTRVPVLYVGPFSMAKMIELRDGQSSLGGNIKEGIVIKALVEGEEVRGLSENRKQLKMVSPAYRLRATGDEIQ